jgi:outer membrane protein assembly factor BamB
MRLPKPRLPRTRRARLTTAAVILLVLVGLGLGAYFYEKHRTGSVYHPNARFVPQPTPALPKKRPSQFTWPLYGYTKSHTRFFPASDKVRPPFKQLWVHTGEALLEFPPVMHGDRIFQLSDDATLHAIDKYTGHEIWTTRLGALSASSPAVSGGTVYATVLSRHTGQEAGRVAALDVANGHLRWSRDLPSRCESSPLLDDGKLFFGTQNGTVYALNAKTGKLIWTYHAPGAVKASPSLSNGVLYFGDYSGQVQAVRERNGHRVWASGSGGALFGSGTFYSTAAVVYGRVYLGNTDGRVYAYDAGNGKLDWAVQTGAYVYASPAVTNAPGIGPTIYLGSYDGTFYAIDARSGKVAWRYHAGGRISGSATIVGRIVYFADLGDHRTFGLGLATGKVVFAKDSGSFDPVISDGHNIYLTGYTGLFGLAPRDPKGAVKAKAAARHSRQRAKTAARHSRSRAKSTRPGRRQRAMPAARHNRRHQARRHSRRRSARRR